MPETEMAYHVGSKTYREEGIKCLSSYPNNCTYGIECCHLNPLSDIYLHQEIVGWKDCHRWWVNNPDDWQAIKWLVKAQMYHGETCLEFE